MLLNVDIYKQGRLGQKNCFVYCYLKDGAISNLFLLQQSFVYGFEEKIQSNWFLFLPDQKLTQWPLITVAKKKSFTR